MQPNATPPGGISARVRQGVPPVPPVPVATPGADPFWDSMRAQDLASLDLLAILHRVAAGLVALTGALGLPAFFLFRALRTMNDTTHEVSPLADSYFGAFGGIVAAIVLAHFAGAVLLWVAAGWIGRRRCYSALLAVQALMLLIVPHGTALGIFGIILLTKPHVRAEFRV